MMTTEELVKQEIEVEPKNAEKEPIEVIVEGDARAHALSIETVLEESKTGDDESWRRTSVSA